MNPSTRLRIIIAVSAIAALTSVIVLLVVVVHMDRARNALQRDGVLEFNFVQQADHNLEALAAAARSLRDGGANGTRNGGGVANGTRNAGADETVPGVEQLLLRYDVLYSMVALPPRWAGNVIEVDGAQETMDDMRRFTLALEPRMTPQSEWSESDLTGIATRALELSRQVHHIGSRVFRRKSALRDAIAQRMDRLIQLFRIFGALFLLAGLTLYLSMARALSIAARSAREAVLSRRQLEGALGELTTGDIDRRARNRFLAAATHDLRQPLQAMQYYLAALGPHVSSPPGRQILGRIARSTDSAQTMLTGLLDLSRLDAGVLEPQPATFDVDALLHRLCEEFSVEASERGLSLRCTGHAGWSLTDPQLLERVLRNLVANALSHTERGTVTLASRRTERATLQLEVQDTGIGIPEPELETVFDEYHQAENSQRLEAGLGLGLSIVRQLTRLLEIPLSVDSVPDRGTRFTLTLPAVAAGPPQPPVREAGVCGRSLDRLVVMVIDDDDAVREGVTILLQQNGCHVECAANIDEALARLVDADLIPDLLLADYRLPGGRTGLEAIDVIREELNEDIPALVVTGDTAPGLPARAHARGAPLLHKPIDSARLFDSIDSLLGSQPLEGATGKRDA